MVLKKKNVFIVYFSPAGSTRHVAKVIEERFLALDTEVASFDLAECKSDVAVTISTKMAKVVCSSVPRYMPLMRFHR